VQIKILLLIYAEEPMKSKTWCFCIAGAFTLFCVCGKSNPAKGNDTTTFTLTVSATNGTVAKLPDLAAYDSNSVVLLTATPSAGYHFTGWSGDTAETVNPMNVLMNSNKNIAANFAINTYVLTVNAGTGGTVTPSGSTTVNYGAATPITAAADSGYKFLRWIRSGTGATITDSTRGSTTVFLTADATITAEFAVNHAPDKPSNPSPVDGAIDQNKSITLSWTGGDVDAGDTVKYDVYLSTINPPTTKASGAQNGTSYALSGLSANTMYYWYVQATDSKLTTQGDVWQFATLPVFPDGTKLVPGGTFQMGSTDSSIERPVHTVTLSSFYMDTTEVTQADYFALMSVNPSHFDSGSTWPMETVTWYDAVLFCNARSKNNGKDTVYTFTSISGTPGDSCWGLGNFGIDYSKNGYRLPTEAEWEYACRAGSTTDYYWGGSYPPVTTLDTAAIDNNVVWPHNSNYKTARVGTRLPNAWGLYDMCGNVKEWCSDWYSSNYYNVSPSTDPTGPVGSYLYRVMRGGSWYYTNSAGYFRSAFRENNTPTNRGIGVGFRCVRR
jgi:uncharacterized repeat protein (TIGR02543 family)